MHQNIPPTDGAIYILQPETQQLWNEDMPTHTPLVHTLKSPGLLEPLCVCVCLCVITLIPGFGLVRVSRFSKLELRIDNGA